MSSIQGIVSARLDDHSFLITPEHADRQNLAPHQLVLIQNGRQEKGKIPARSFLLHQQIYKDHPHIHFIISAQPPCAMAYAITGHEYEYKIIAETYITLKSIAFVPFEWQVDAPEKISAMLAGKTPVLLLRNEAIITAGQTALAAFDRLEVAEFCARAQIDAMKIGRLVPLNEEQTREMDRIYFPEMTI